jgi:HD superfamily phosphohydrolase
MPKKQRIYDAVYGYIELDDAEFALVTLPIFQRLHWIKQLGPLHTVFPSAQHSRFSHTIGVFHIVKKMIEHLKGRQDRYVYEFRGNEEELLKFAALLHDIGHVPLSHIGEEVLKDTVKEGLREKSSTQMEDMKGIFDPFAEREPSWWSLFPEEKYHGDNTKLHERLSAEIVLHSKDIDAVLKRVSGWENEKERGEAKDRIAKIIVGQNYLDVSTLLLHSELDADRLDYLLRDSFFTGVGYGRIDLDYIISRLAIFRGEKNVADLCIEFKGLHTVEHYILGRFFLQTQVIFNRKVRFMDLLFRDVMEYMVKHRSEDWSLMGLEEICECVRSNSVEDLHNMYS